MPAAFQADSSGPIADSSRVLSIDVVRGVALLGIFFVNAAFFGIPFGDFFESATLENASPTDRVVYWITAVFFTGKFYPLFSILFGAGLAIIYESTRTSGRSFTFVYLRRMIVLAAFGLAHILLLWYGDILLLYAIVGLAMLLLGRASSKTLLWVASVVFAFSIVSSVGFAALSTSGASSVQVEPTILEIPEASTRIGQLGKVLSSWNADENYDSRITQLEKEIQSQGSFFDAMLLRLFLYSFSLVYYVCVTVWVVLPCFCIGAALTKSGFFQNPNSVWRGRLIGLGVLVGLPLSILAAVASESGDSFARLSVSMVGRNVGGILMSLGYLSLTVKRVERNPNSRLAISVGQLGRMALTGYLLESLLMSAIMSHWGLAWFGTTTWTGRAALVVVIYVAILFFANIWMRLFRFGPMEWLWRSLCYLKPQPMLRQG